MQPIDFFYHSVRTFPKNKAVFEESSKTTLDYEQLASRVNALACYIQQESDVDRPVISVLADNSIEMLTVILATYACNGIITPLTPTNVEQDIAYQIDFAKPQFIFIEAKYLDLIQSYQGKKILINKKVDLPEYVEINQLLKDYDNQIPQRPNIQLSQKAAIKFTGGSTGRPKAVVQSLRCLNTMTISLREVFELNAQENFLICAPLTHGAGTFVLPVLSKGGCLTITNKLPAEQLLFTIKQEEITSIWLPPTLLHRLVNIQQHERYELPHLKNILFGGAPCTDKLYAQALEYFGSKLGVTYGLTEAPTIIAGMPGKDSENPRNHNCAGFVGPLTRVAVALEDGSISEMPNQMGEIVAAGDLLMTEYLDMPEETAKTIQEGWLHTGDIGYIDERGCLFIKGRSKEVIISGGFNIFPSEVEHIYAKHDAISECFVFGNPDEQWGERVEMAITLHPNQTNSSELKEALIAYGKEKLGSIKTPKKIHVLHEFKKNELGKVDKKSIIKTLN